MSMRNFGYALSGALQGIGPGMQLGAKLKENKKQKAIENIHQEGIKSATESRNADLDSKIQTYSPQGIPAYVVDGKAYDKQEDARSVVAKDADSLSEYFLRDAAPKISAEYMAQGNAEKSLAWEKYISDDNGKKAIKDWSTSFMAARNGDWDNAAKGFGEYYSNYVQDGVNYEGHELVKSEDGKVTGFNLTLKDTDTGKSTTVPMSTEDLVELGTASNPQAIFEMAASQAETANKAKLKNASDNALADRKHSQSIQLKGIDQENAVELQRIKNANAVALEGIKSSNGGRSGSVPADIQIVKQMVADGAAANEAEAWDRLSVRNSTAPIDWAQSYADAQFKAQSEKSQYSMTDEEKKNILTYDQLVEKGLELHKLGTTRQTQPAPATNGLPAWSNVMVPNP